jgi:hypothetical protein
MVEQIDLEQSPIVSIFCPPPVSIVITSNTFVQFNHLNKTVVGLVLTVNPLELKVSIRLFLTWDDVKERLGTIHLPQNVTFWPKDNRYPPHYLCDTDLIIHDVPVANIIGLAFVFHDNSPMQCQITGMRNSYRVTSCVWLTQNLITHGTTFRPFPSERFPSILTSCFPSMIFDF